MLRNPKKTLQAINNCVTVALPLTSIDLDTIIEKVLEQTSSNTIQGMTDVDLTTEGVEDGSLLVYMSIIHGMPTVRLQYNKALQKWQSTKTLDRQVINAGEY